MTTVMIDPRPAIRRRIGRKLGYPVRVEWHGDGDNVPWSVGVVVPDLRSPLADYCKSPHILFALPPSFWAGLSPWLRPRPQGGVIAGSRPA
jgi:hypothetical protein